MPDFSFQKKIAGEIHAGRALVGLSDRPKQTGKPVPKEGKKMAPKNYAFLTSEMVPFFRSGDFSFRKGKSGI